MADKRVIKTGFRKVLTDSLRDCQLVHSNHPITLILKSQEQVSSDQYKNCTCSERAQSAVFLCGNRKPKALRLTIQTKEKIFHMKISGIITQIQILTCFLMMLRHRCSQRLKCVECIHTNQHHHHEDTQELKSRRKKIKYREVRVTYHWTIFKKRQWHLFCWSQYFLLCTVYFFLG